MQISAIRGESTFVDLQGVTIHQYRWQPGRPKAAVLIAHGLGEHALRWEHVAQRLVNAGYSVWAIDQRGHGATGIEQHAGDLTKLGKLGPGGVRAVVGGLVTTLKRMRGAHRELPIGLLAHSWGSLSAQMLLQRHSNLLDAVVLTGTAYRVPGWMHTGDLNARHAHLGATGYEWLSRDPAVAEAFAADPLTFPAKVVPLFGVADAARLLGVPGKMSHRIPMLIAGGSDDTLGGTRSMQRLAEAYRKRSGLTDVTVTVYPGARHEIVNEINQVKVLDDIVAWFDARLLESEEG